MSSEVAIDERIQQLVEAHRPELEQLIDQALARELETLVAERIAATNGANGNYALEYAIPVVTSTEVTKEPLAPTMKTCVGACGRTLPASAFEARRLKCRECRRDEARERARRAAEPEPEPEPAPVEADLRELGSSLSSLSAAAITPTELRSRVEFNGVVAGDLEPWLVREGLAEYTTGGLTATPLAVELGAGIS